MHTHRWILDHYERGISKGKCQCGAVGYFTNVYNRDNIQRVAALNTKELQKEKEMVIEVKHPEPLPLVPPKPSGRNAVHQYYEQNKEQLLAKIKQHGSHTTRLRWGINSSTMVCLRQRWGLLVRSHKPRVKAPELDTTPGPPARPIVEFDGGSRMVVTLTSSDLELLDEDDFTSFWGMVGKVIGKRATAPPQE